MEEGSEEFKEWKDPTAPVYYLFTVFNVTNAEDVVNGTAKPNVSEKGPYYYRYYTSTGIVLYCLLLCVKPSCGCV